VSRTPKLTTTSTTVSEPSGVGFGRQGEASSPEVQTSYNGGGAASNVTNLELKNNIATNITAAFGTLSFNTDDNNRLPRFFVANMEPYNITTGSRTIVPVVDGVTLSPSR